MKDILYQLAEIGTDESKILYRLIKENPEDMKDPNKLAEYFKFLLGHCSRLQSAKIIKLNKQIAEGIEDLVYETQWTNLLNVARHALDATIEAIGKDTDISSTEAGKNLVKEINRIRSQF